MGGVSAISQRDAFEIMSRASVKHPKSDSDTSQSIKANAMCNDCDSRTECG